MAYAKAPAAPKMTEVPTCPMCHKPMKYKTWFKSGKSGAMWGCSGYPHCRGTRNSNYNPAKAALAKASAFALPFTPTAEQVSIWDEMKDGNSHIVVQAYAGTGKSTTTRVGMFRVDTDLTVFYGCFGNRAVSEFDEKGVPDHAVVKTFSSFGNTMLLAAFPHLKGRLNKQKTLDIVDSIWPHETSGVEKQEHNTVKFAVDKVVGLVKGYLTDFNDALALTDVCERHDVDFENDIEKAKVFELVPKVMAISNNPQNAFGYDFNDQLYWPVVLKLAVKKFDVICVDEAQDCNACQHALILRMCHARTRVVVIGDDNQAIFGFRGSDTDSMSNFSQKLEAETGKTVTGLGLTITQRCPKKIVKLAQRYVPGIVAREDAPEGNIYAVTDSSATPLYRPGDMVVCRVNAPLLGIAFSLIKQGTKALVLGRDIAEQLKNLVKRLRGKNDSMSVNSLLLALDRWVLEQCKKYENSRFAESKAQQFNDQADCVRVLADESETIEQIFDKITSIFADERDGKPVAAVVLSSIHKAKGLESKNVFWLYPNITCKGTQEWQMQQEKNLKYVAITRTMETLYLVYEKGKNPGEFPLPAGLTAEIVAADERNATAAKARKNKNKNLQRVVNLSNANADEYTIEELQKIAADAGVTILPDWNAARILQAIESAIAGEMEVQQIEGSQL